MKAILVINEDCYQLNRGFLWYSETLVLFVNQGNGILKNLTSSLPNAIVEILRAKQNGIFILQWLRWLDLKRRHLCLWVYSKGLSKYSFRYLCIKMSRNDNWLLLYSIINCIEGSIEFKVSNKSSGLIWWLLQTV